MAHEKNHDYAILPPSILPLIGAVSGFVMLVGAILWMHSLGSENVNFYVFAIGLAGVLYTMFAWWSEMVRESQAGMNTQVVRIGLREGFLMFVVSEIFFFFAWFWAFFKNAIYPMPAINGVWPPEGIVTFDPWHLPLINTLILVLSSCFVTFAHHDLAEKGDNNQRAARFIILAVLLGIAFSFFQFYEYSHAAFGFSGNIYGATFYMATGFHGFHVIVGTIFLFVCWLRARAGQFTQHQHVGFEAAAWYWHFVDVVWIFLFVAIYVWGG